MAERLETITGEGVQPMAGTIDPSVGSTGMRTQVAGQATTVSNAAEATGGIGTGNFIETDIDTDLFKFNGDDTPLMQLMLSAKTVKVNSPEVEHFMIDEPKSKVTTISAVAAGKAQALLPLAEEEQEILRNYTTLLVPDVDCYEADGKTKSIFKGLMLIVTGQDPASGNPIVRALNGTKTNPTDEYTSMVAIPAGSTVRILGNALYETQKKVDPDLIVPKGKLVYLQKRGMNHVVSDYYEAQKKHIPFSKSLIAEAAISNFKLRGNRTLWGGRASKIKVDTKEVGMQYIYTTEGMRYKFKKTFQHKGKWTFEEFIALTKMFYTGEDVPKNAICLCGKNFLEGVQCIDFSKHPEVQVTQKYNKSLGWEVTNIHTVFGDFQFKREPTLDTLGWSNSCAIIGEGRLVHYKYTNEHTFNEDVEGEEAKRSGIIVWDALELKGTCHIWVDGEGESTGGGVRFAIHDDANAPTKPVDGVVYYLLQDCPAISVSANAGELWQYTAGSGGGTGTWKEYNGEILAEN